ncbi:MAG: hypothetical protein JW878_05520 [Methanomicrobia archaeon]|nr:hypothetical protein [Methanomicrobia archaeon]
MEETNCYDNFPAWMALLATAVTLAIYGIGAYILVGFSIIIAILYLLYCLWIEQRVLRRSCVNCFYYGKTCGLGRGKLCSVLFEKGDPQRFAAAEISWTAILPDFLVFIIPLVGGIILIMMAFTWLLVALVALFAILAFGGTAVIRGSFACKYCKQREIGCPAERLFSKEETHHE